MNSFAAPLFNRKVTKTSMGEAEVLLLNFVDITNHHKYCAIHYKHSNPRLIKLSQAKIQPVRAD